MNLRHHPDGWVYLGDFRMSMSEVAAVAPWYDMPAASCLEYDSTRSVVWINGDQRAGPLPWPVGDRMLAEAATIMAAVLALREPPPPTRRPRTLAAILADLDALTAAQVLAKLRRLLAREIRRQPDFDPDIPGDEPIV